MSVLLDEGAAAGGETVIFALGANLPGPYRSPDQLLEAAVRELLRSDLRRARRSSIWRSAAWPDPTQPEYRNLVVMAQTPRSPGELLRMALDLEASFGRVRGAPNAPRTLDVDLIAYGRRLIDEPGLIVPHPRAHQRLFVMGPLAEVAPDWRHPVSGLTAAELAASAEVGRDATPLAPH